jgi:ABC-2 type transport system ATP-binding protein
MRLDTADMYSLGSTRRARVAEALGRVGLSAAAGKRVKAYSLGMKQRLGIANALLAPRDLLVLDEPTNGLDPQGTREVRSLIRSLAADGTTVFVSSHLLAEIEQVCTHAAIMSGGRLVAQGTLDELRGDTGARVVVRTPDPAAAIAVLAELGLAFLDEATAPGGDGTEVRASIGGAAKIDRPAPDVVVAALVASGVRVRGFALEHESLEDRFVELTGEGFNVER